MTERNAAAPPPVPSHRQRAALLISNIVYLLICFGGSLNSYPLAPDHYRFGNLDALALPAKLFIYAALQLFGTTLWPWHVLNLILLWICMNGLFFLTRWSIGGMWWLGSLAAVLLMAHPLKGDAALSLTASVHLLPAASALWGIAAYASYIQRAAAWKMALAFLGLIVPMVFFAEYRGLVFVPLLYEIFVVPREERRWWRAAIALPGFIAGVLHFGMGQRGYDFITIEDRVAPLFLTVYPIGLLPETVLRLQDALWLFWLLAGIALLITIWIGFRVRHGVFWFGVLGAAAFQLIQGEQRVDLIHFGHGGVMLIPIALMALAVAALSHQVMQHPKWPRYVVALTTVLCMLFMGLQIRSVLVWREAGRQVAAFQAVAAGVANAHKSQTLQPAPDFLYYRDAPMLFSTSISNYSPFYPVNSVGGYYPVLPGNPVCWNPNNPTEPLPYVPGFIRPRQLPIEFQETEEPDDIVLIPFPPSDAENED